MKEDKASNSKRALVQGVISLDFKVRAPSKGTTSYLTVSLDNGFKDRHYRDTSVLDGSIVSVINDTQPKRHIVFIRGHIGAVKTIDQAGLSIFNLYDGQASIACCYYSTECDTTKYICKNKSVKVVGRKQVNYKACRGVELPLCIQAFQVTENVSDE
jgi:hypothetical protein